MIKRENREKYGGIIDAQGNPHYFYFDKSQGNALSLCHYMRNAKKVFLPLSNEILEYYVPNTMGVMNMEEVLEKNPECNILFLNVTDFSNAMYHQRIWKLRHEGKLAYHEILKVIEVPRHEILKVIEVPRH